MVSSSRAPTTTSYAILGLLSVRSWTTYELAKQVQRSLNWFWPRAERRLYDEPKLLVAGGLATAAKEFTGQRPRTVYGITDAGRRALEHWLGLPSAPRGVEFEGMLKVFFADAGSSEQLSATLDQMAREARDRLGQLREWAAQAAEQGAMFPHREHLTALGLRLQLEQEQAVLGWVRWAQTQTGAWTSTTDPGSWDSRAVLSQLADDIAERLDQDAAALGRHPGRTDA